MTERQNKTTGRQSGLGNLLNARRTERRNAIKAFAYELFRGHGYENTSIDDIVGKAGIAKGTFYLYYPNKPELLNEIVAEKSNVLLIQAYERIQTQAFAAPLDRLVAYIGELVTLLSADKPLLELIYKNLSWGYFRSIVSETEREGPMREFRKAFLECIYESSQPGRDPEKLLFVILELTSSVSYSAIIRKEPAEMDQVLPLLLDSVRRIVA